MSSPSPLLNASAAFLRDLDRQADAAVKALMRQYEQTQRNLLAALDRLQKQMQDVENPTKGQLYRLDRYQSLLEQVGREMGTMGNRIAGTLNGVITDAATIGVNAAGELALLQTSGTLYKDIKGAFTTLSVPDITKAVSFTQPGSPLMQMLRAQYGESWAQVIASQYVSGVALGWSPMRTIAALKQTVTTAAPADISRIIRTAQIYGYREVNRNAWVQSNVVDYWVWDATLDDTCCGSCFAMHGTKHDVSEVLADHHNGRCAALPHVVGNEDYQTDELNPLSGEDEFSKLSASEQERIASGGGWGAQYRAWVDGKIQFSDMTRTTTDNIYGDMRGLAPLQSLLGDKAQVYYK